MKRVVLLFILTLALLANAKELKVLTIGNSFAESVFGDFPKIAASVPDCKLLLQRANIGGCTLERHCKEIQKADADPSYKPYSKKFTLKELLKQQKWDIVTLQQASHKSFNEKTFEPYLKTLIDYVRKYAPQAEIVLQMTWSYHPTHPLFFKAKALVKNQDEMFAKIEENYAKFAKKYSLRVIPSGLAVQLARKNLTKKQPEPSANPADYVEPKAPGDSPNYFVVIGSWRNNKKTGKKELRFDRIHLDANGRYLQSCVWFAELFGKKTSEIRYVPKNMPPEKAKYFQSMAQKAVDEYPQPGLKK